MFRNFRSLLYPLLGILSIVAISCKEPTRPDTRPPRISIVTPHRDELIEGPVKIIADATDNRDVSFVTFLVDEQVILQDSLPNFGFLWYPAFWADGDFHTLSAIATDASGNQAQSRSVNVKVSQQAREAPKLLTPPNHAILEDHNKVTLRWKRQAGAVSYRFALATDSIFSHILYSEEIGDTTYQTPPLKPGQYYWIVVAYNTLGFTGAWSYYRQFTVKAPGIPVILSPADHFFYKSDDALRLQWEAVDHAVRYELRVWPEGNPRKLLIDTKTEKLSATIKLAPEAWYQWQVRAVNAGDLQSDWIDTRKFYVPAEELLDFTTVPSGEYIYGPDSRIEFIEYHFEIMRYPVTCAQYMLFLNQALSRGTVDRNARGHYAGDEAFPAGNYSYLDIRSRQPEFGDIFYDPQREHFVLDDPQFLDHPVADVSWFGAHAFAQWYGFELPTEFEWEKTARNYSGNEYPWGNDISCAHANIACQDTGAVPFGTTPVGYYNGTRGTVDAASPYGAYDMCGNVWEWTASWYGANFPQRRVIKGGSYSDTPRTEIGRRSLKVWYRQPQDPREFSGKLRAGIGFRCAKRIEQQLPEDFLPE